jgi:hypothetical protein
MRLKPIITLGGNMGAYPVALLRCLNHDLRQFPSSQEVWPGATPKEVAASSIRRSLLKKWESENSDEADEACLLKFMQVNENCKNWKLDVERLQTWEEELWGEFKSSLYRFFHPGGYPLVDNYAQILAFGRVGPGASRGSLGGDFYTKLFSSPLTTTRSVLYDEYRRYVRNFPEWSNAEAIRQLNYGEPHIVKGNSLSFVPKYTHISRFICTEPSLNMFYQLGLGQILTDRLKAYFGIDLTVQQFNNRELARRGSLDGGYSTLDLESASDSVSLKMCDAVLPGWFNTLLGKLRSPTSVIRGREHELFMVSTMGNGFTFPLQTILFSCMVEAAAKWAGFSIRRPGSRWDPLSNVRRYDQGTFAVFGDDIICPVEITRYVMKLLEMAGFSVNHSKSFVEGPFKESCGADYYHGINVRGVYIRRLETKQDFYSAINQLNLFSTRTGLRLPTTIRWLLARVPWNPVPRWEDDSSGVKVPLSLLRNPRICLDTGSILYYPYVADTLRIRIGESAIFSPKGVKRRIYNPSGLFVAYLQGSINGAAIPVRHDQVKWRRKLRVAPNWDAPPTAHPLAGWFCWQRWDNAVYLNL